jgi:hypothetical protein
LRFCFGCVEFSDPCASNLAFVSGKRIRLTFERRN